MNNIQNIALANHCPLIGGPAVLQARTLLAVAGYNPWEFSHTCPTPILEVDWESQLRKSPTSNETQTVQLYPNPAHTSLNITFKDVYQGPISISNALGQTLYQAEVHTDHLDINTATLPAGIYLIRINTPKPEVHKLIIQH